MVDWVYSFYIFIGSEVGHVGVTKILWGGVQEYRGVLIHLRLQAAHCQEPSCSTSVCFAVRDWIALLWKKNWSCTFAGMRAIITFCPVPTTCDRAHYFTSENKCAY